MSDVALRKKKNADAQAAFRARRANYISTLEETVTNLESVVLQLQQSCRESRHETQELRQENGRLRLQLKERENFWRNVWSRRNQGEGDDFPVPPSFSPTTLNATLATAGSQVHQYSGDEPGYREDSTALRIPYTYESGTNQTQSPTVTYSSVDTDISGQRASKYPSKYQSYFPPGTRTSWPAQSITQSSSSGGESGARPSSTHSSNSPTYGVESPTLAPSEMPFNRFTTSPEEQKASVTNSLETTPFVFTSSRSLSPTTSTPPSTNSAPLAPFPFHITDTVQDRHIAGDPSLSGATCDVAFGGSVGNDGRYGLPDKRASDGSVLPPLSSGSDNGSDAGDSGGGAQISGTLAVIKAQSFGGLRRSRTRTKRPVDTAAKVAMDVLESRGIDVQVGVKRRRRNEDDIDVPS
ncbi:hypothetical protein V5O48_010146 [Marasmius crinis-equi]|uniref:BZIP domain-containing protein n=1 Tax=Marasmius crinis-equi TaxID=585013 RepID=A0ABR3F9J0_9AGAR